MNQDKTKTSILEKISKLKELDTVKFIHYNYFCKNIIRDKGCYVIPFKNSIIELDKSSKIVLKANLHIGINKLKGSHAETYIQLKKNSVWNVNGEVLMFYNTIVELFENAQFDSDFFSVNSGSAIMCAKHITFGKNVMLGREIMIYDSDHHKVLDENGNPTNPAKDVIIGDNVWLTNRITVLKGTTINSGALVSSMSLIRKDVPENSLVASTDQAKTLKTGIHWSRY